MLPALLALALSGPFRFDVRIDAPIVSLSAAGASAAFVESSPPPCLPRCAPPDDPGWLDRRVVGNWSLGAHRAADAFVVGLLTLPHVAGFAARGDARASVEDLALSLEAWFMAQGMTQPVKVAASRWAPLVYANDAPLDVRESATRSFWSAHTAGAFAAATSFTFAYWARHPRDPWRWVVLAATESAAMMVGLLRMRAGYHYPTDVLAGALAGVAAGLVVPALHLRF